MVGNRSGGGEKGKEAGKAGMLAAGVLKTLPKRQSALPCLW